MASDYKPDLATMPKHVQDAVGALVGVIDEGVANNPKLAQEEKMARLIEGAGAFKGIAGNIQVGGGQVAARAVGSKPEELGGSISV